MGPYVQVEGEERSGVREGRIEEGQTEEDVCPAHAVVFTVAKKEGTQRSKLISHRGRRPHAKQT